MTVRYLLCYAEFNSYKGGCLVGNVYRIGELAQLAHVSRRTIDYYTNLGLLKAERSDSNYRYYDETALDTLKYIESYKKIHVPLCEIKELLQQRQSERQNKDVVMEQLSGISKQMHELEHELLQIRPLLDSLTDEQQQRLKQHLSTQTSALVHTLSVLLA